MLLPRPPALRSTKTQIGPPSAHALFVLMAGLMLLCLCPSARAGADTIARSNEPVHARCFVKHYQMQKMTIVGANHSLPSPSPHAITFFTSELDLLVPVPLMISFDSISLSRVTADHCAVHMKSDQIRFTWSSDPDYDAAFNSVRTGCGSRSPLYFGLSTLGQHEWGVRSRSVNDGRIFRPQSSRVSMRTGMYNENQSPKRIRPLGIAMYSSRDFERQLGVSVCILSTEVPYDMPSDMYEITAPRLLPLVGCVRDITGRCGVNIGYLSSHPVTPIDLPFGSAGNKLVPLGLENGFDMPSVFTEGLHLPESFDPPMRIAWQCEDDESEQDFVWKLDGLQLRFNNLDFICPMAVSVATLGINGVAEDEAEQRREMKHYQNLDPFIDTTLKVAHRRKGTIKEADALEAWANAGVRQTHYSTVARDAHIKAEKLAYEGSYEESKAVRSKYRPTKGEAAAMGIGRR